ncbi:MAG: hypothetical protein IKL84_05955, partial [Clostridia bacterium]|nr:hypothetical protein [Clostridia bacterium]
MTVRDIMNAQVVSVSPQEEIVRVAVLSIQEDNGFPVSDVCTAVSVLDAWKGDLRVGARVEILESGGAGSTVLGGIPRMALDR